MIANVRAGSKAAGFIEPMECLALAEVPEGPEWTYEIKLDGYRVLAVKSAGHLSLYSRRGNDFTARFNVIADSLRDLPDETVIDGELVALDNEGRPSFDLLQNYRSAARDLKFYAFDVLIHRSRDVMATPLSERRKILRSIIEPTDHIGQSEVSQSTAAEMIDFVKAHGLEGVIAKKAHSVYQPGMRTGLWCKHRINEREEFVIGGYVSSHLGVDALVVGLYRRGELHYAARVRAGFVPLTRRKVFEEIKGLRTAECPFVNLPEREAGRWGQGLTAEKMKECVWVKPERTAEIEFLERTGSDHLRHPKFVTLL